MLLRHMHETFTIIEQYEMEQYEKDGFCIDQQLQELEGRKAEEDAVQQWSGGFRRAFSIDHNSTGDKPNIKFMTV